jgi:hypothetical protein
MEYGIDCHLFRPSLRRYVGFEVFTAIFWDVVPNPEDGILLKGEFPQF